MKVKICGIKTVEEIGYCNELLPDFIGFVFAKSKRQVSIITQREESRCFLQKCSTIITVKNIKLIIYPLIFRAEPFSVNAAVRYYTLCRTYPLLPRRAPSL